MSCVDITGNPRIPILMKMVGAVSRAKTPQEIYERFRRGITELTGMSGYIALSVRGLQPGEYKMTHIELHGQDGGETANPWRDWDRIKTHRGGFFGELIRSAWPEVIHHLDIGDDPVVGNMLAPFGSMMAVPIFDDGEPLNWAIIVGDEPDLFTVKDLEDAILRANLVGGMTKNAVISEQLRHAHERIQREVEQIANIQRSLLPDPLPEIKGVTLAASYETSAQAGGDYYDFFPLVDENTEPGPSNRWGILIADASGHGPSAAVVMAMLHGILHAFPDRDHGPAEILQHANRHLCEKRLEASFVTAFYGIYDPIHRTLRYARAGHNPPVVKDGSSIKRLNAVGGLPLGIERDFTLDEDCVQLAPGQTIIFYTDGVTEAFNEEGRMFGINGIERALTECSGEARCTVLSIEQALKEHEGDGPIRDDQTVVALEILD